MYIRKQKVKNLNRLVKHFMIPPRLYMGSRHHFLGGLIQYGAYAGESAFNVADDVECSQ